MRTDTRGSSEGEVDHPCGLCIDYNGEVYVADRDNNRVCIYSENLAFLNCLGTQQLKSPRDVKVTPNGIAVLDCSNYCVHFYWRNGDLINSYVSNVWDGIFPFPMYFCLDPAGNILCSDYYRNIIKIFSPSGELIHIVGNIAGRRKGCNIPCGICISTLGTIFVVAHLEIPVYNYFSCYNFCNYLMRTNFNRPFVFVLTMFHYSLLILVILAISSTIGGA
ncbi:hypothetical protein LOD99_1694 [Oopsacas minuta]|uniref:Uncharacterized protein n=1 Tax=Oopsacas minuta TaxID=111878 RepID=A0AAV7K5Q0_9METZ|nr:hypothetical protein LOD99_1694 [Oopsacas minuta]